MQVELIKPWNRFRVGHVFANMHDGVANVLIKRLKVAKNVDVQKQDGRGEPGDATGGSSDRAGDSSGSSQAMRTRHKHRSR